MKVDNASEYGSSRRTFRPEVSEREVRRSALVVDDHPVVRRGLRELLSELAGLAACWEASTPTEALDRTAEHSPDLALVDITFAKYGEAAGLDLIGRLRGAVPTPPRVLAVSMQDETIYAHRALSAGAHGYIMKCAPDEELVLAVQRVLAGRLYMSPQMRKRLSKHPARKRGETSREDEAFPIDVLSDRELEVFILIGRGFAPRHIAEQLSLSVKTIGTHRRHVRQKLKLEDAAELTRYAVAWSKQRSTREQDALSSGAGDAASRKDAQ